MSEIKSLKKELKFLVGDISNLNNLKPVVLKHFDDLIINFLDEFSIYLKKVNKIYYLSDLESLSFWTRKKNLITLSKKLKKINNKGLGTVFHITPSNIPTNFAYSLFISLINGNSNIIKLPSKNLQQIQIICNILKKILTRKKFVKIKSMITVLKYKDNDKITELISKISDSRMIWGGDNTVKSIKKIQSKPNCLDIVFPDRYSLSIININSLLKLDHHQFKLLITNFYNDTYLVDQNACSSPHLILWLGKNLKIKNKFWKELSLYAKSKYKNEQYFNLEKYSKMLDDIMCLKNISDIKIYESLTYVVYLKNLNWNLETLRGKWGYFYDYDIENINKLTKFVTKKFQTLTYYGISKKILNNFINQTDLHGIDRIIPIGQSLNIDFNWDSYDLSSILSRQVKLG